MLENRAKYSLTESPAEKLQSAHLITVKFKNVLWFKKHKLSSKLIDFITSLVDRRLQYRQPELFFSNNILANRHASSYHNFLCNLFGPTNGQARIADVY